MRKAGATCIIGEPFAWATRVWQYDVTSDDGREAAIESASLARYNEVGSLCPVRLTLDAQEWSVLHNVEAFDIKRVGEGAAKLIAMFEALDIARSAKLSPSVNKPTL